MEVKKIKENTFDMFPVGTPVIVVSEVVDMTFFYGESGTVINNKGTYLGILVEFDKPIMIRGGHAVRKFNFNPENLQILSPLEKKLDTMKTIEEQYVDKLFNLIGVRNEHWSKEALKIFTEYGNEKRIQAIDECSRAVDIKYENIKTNLNSLRDK